MNAEQQLEVLQKWSIEWHDMIERGEDPGRSVYDPPPEIFYEVFGEDFFIESQRSDLLKQIPERYKDSTIGNWKTKGNAWIKIISDVKYSTGFSINLWVGTSGTGKTHLLYGLYKQHIDELPKLVRWAYMASLFSSHKTTDIDGHEANPFTHIEKQFNRHNIIMIDDYNPYINEQTGSLSKFQLECFFEFIDYCARNHKKLYIVSNHTKDYVLSSLGFYLPNFEQRMKHRGGQFIDFSKIEAY